MLSTGEGPKSSPTLSGSRGVLLILDVWGLAIGKGEPDLKGRSVPGGQTLCSTGTEFRYFQGRLRAQNTKMASADEKLLANVQDQMSR